MITNIVVISRNQKDYLEKMIDALGELLPRAIFVLDRCYDGSKRLCKKRGVRYVCTPWYWTGRHTSSCRNLGLSLCEKDSNVLFLDGDRYPVEGILDFSNIKEDINLLRLEKDNRNEWIFYNAHYGKIKNGFYSCGIFFKRDAINKIINFQGELFNTDIEKYWGIEDTYLGDVSYHLGLTCSLNQDIKLNGYFDNLKVDRDVMKIRYKKRSKLNVRW